jgi:ferredoxin
MAIVKSGDKVFAIGNGCSMKDAGETLDIVYGCHVGCCGICRVKVIKGAENLSKKSTAEGYYPLKEDERLSCQCKVLQGEVEIKIVHRFGSLR